MDTMILPKKGQTFAAYIQVCQNDRNVTAICYEAWYIAVNFRSKPRTG